MTNQAAERLRQAIERYRTKAYQPGHFGDADYRNVGYLTGAEGWDDRVLLANAYVQEHAADDGEAITHQWFRSLPQWRPVVGRVIVGEYELGIGAWFVFLDYGSSNTVPLPHIKTRGQLRMLLKALGVSGE